MQNNKLLPKLLQRARKFEGITGFSRHKFWELVAALQPAWEQRNKTKKKEGRPYGIGELADQLLCLLIYYRTHVTMLDLSTRFHVNDATVCRSIKRLEPIVHAVIGIKRDPVLTKQQMEQLIVDCTRQPVQRPQKNQKAQFGGKNKRHEVAFEVWVTQAGEIVFVSETAPGSMHDLAIHKQRPLPPGAKALLDGGYQGAHKIYEGSVEVCIPIRKKRGKPRTKEEVEYNRALAKVRVRIEHKFREMKIFRILQQKYRNSLTSHGVKTTIIAGFVNFKHGF